MSLVRSTIGGGDCCRRAKLAEAGRCRLTCSFAGRRVSCLGSPCGLRPARLAIYPRGCEVAGQGFWRGASAIRVRVILGGRAVARYAAPGDAAMRRRPGPKRKGRISILYHRQAKGRVAAARAETAGQNERSWVAGRDAVCPTSCSRTGRPMPALFQVVVRHLQRPTESRRRALQVRSSVIVAASGSSRWAALLSM